MEQNKKQVKVNVSLTQQIAVEVELGKRKAMKHKSRILEISNQNEVYYLHPETILYVEADGNYCDIHLTDGDVLETISFQRSEIARKIDTQLSRDLASMFSLVGKPYLVNLVHIMHINPAKQTLTFDINQPGTCKKKGIKVSQGALRNLRCALEEEKQPAQLTHNSQGRINGGFSNYLASAKKKQEANYETGEDEVLLLGLKG